MTERKVNFNFHCSKDIEFDISSVRETKKCHYDFNIYTKEACNVFIANSSSWSSMSPLALIFNIIFWMICIIFWVVYYALVGLVIYSIY